MYIYLHINSTVYRCVNIYLYKNVTIYVIATILSAAMHIRRTIIIIRYTPDNFWKAQILWTWFLRATEFNFISHSYTITIQCMGNFKYGKIRMFSNILRSYMTLPITFENTKRQAQLVHPHRHIHTCMFVRVCMQLEMKYAYFKQEWACNSNEKSKKDRHGRRLSGVWSA